MSARSAKCDHSYFFVADDDSEDGNFDDAMLAKHLARENLKLRAELRAQKAASKATGKAAAAPADAEQATFGSGATTLTKAQVGAETCLMSAWFIFGSPGIPEFN